MRTVLITGVSTGIGRAIAEELLKSDFLVIGSVRKKEDARYLEENYNDKFQSVIFDVTKKDEILNAKEDVENFLKEKQSYLSCVINNAGVAFGGPVRYLSVDDFRKQFEVNFFGLIEVSKIFLDLLIDSNTHKMKNKIINMGSISGKRSYPFVGPYTASKFALEGFTDAFRRELLIHNIDVVLIEPGPIKTPIWDKIPDIDNNRKDYDIISWSLVPGDLIAFNFATVHGAPGNNSLNRRRAFSARFTGDDATYAKRKGETSPPFPEVTLNHGDAMDCSAFPQIELNNG